MTVDDDGDHYEFYPCIVDDAPASIFLNMRFEGSTPPEDAGTLYWLSYEMRDPGEHGIGSADEAGVLNAIEDDLIARAAAIALVYVGRLRNRGNWQTAFYGPPHQLDALRELAEEIGGDRRFQAASKPDAAWSYYRDFLLPDAERRQWMMDRRLVHVLQEQGDALVIARRVDHWAYFTSAAARDRFIDAAERAGFTVHAMTEGEGRLGAQVYRKDPVELDHIHDVVMTLVDAAEAHGGQYDGWETSIERAS